MVTNSFNPNKNWTVKSILKDYWSTYLESHTPREVEFKEVEKTLKCYEKESGCFVYKCPNCDLEHLVKIGCNSRLCSTCGKHYADKWSESLSQRMFKTPHRHIVVGVPDILWSWLKDHRSIWKDYMDAAIITLNDVFSYLKKQKLTVGAIVILHPFGKDINFKPHLHLIITEGGFDINKKFIRECFITASVFRRKWQYHVLRMLQSCGLPNNLANQCYSKYKNGFYVWLAKEGRVKNRKIISKYLGRYVRHPAIADCRIIKFEGGYVTFYSRDRNDNDRAEIITMKVAKFIEAILQHIPEPQFKMIRYYGAYSRNNVKSYRISLKQSSIEKVKLTKFLEKEPIICPHCNIEMKLVGFRQYEPP